MAIRVLVFDPLNAGDIEKFEKDLDFYLSDGWEMVTTIAGNRVGVGWGNRSQRLSKVQSPEYKDYVVCILRNAASQQDMSRTEVVKRSQ